MKYVIQDIKGEYAYLKRIDIEDDDLFMIAMALLPMEADVGVKLSYEDYSYSVIR